MPPGRAARDLRGLSNIAGHAVTVLGVASAEEWYGTASAHRPLPDEKDDCEAVMEGLRRESGSP